MGFRVSWISKENPYNICNPRGKEEHMSCELNQEEEEDAMEWGLGFMR
jgi:hypothetical protein